MKRVGIVNLKSDIIDRVKNVTKDCRTFLWVRSVYSKDLDDSEIKIGGGNLLIALGAFVALEYLSKVNYCLSKMKNNLPLKNGSYDPVSVDCFVYLIKKTKLPVNLGIENLIEQDLKKLWDDWRNKLGHFNVQRYSHSAVSFLSVNDPDGRAQYIKFINGLSIKKPAFEKIASGWRCYIDILNRDIDIIAGYIANDVFNNANEKNKLLLREWLDKNLLATPDPENPTLR